MSTRFSGRILAADTETMLAWGRLRGQARKTGKPKPVVDSLIAATAVRHDLTLVTRNTDDFDTLPVRLLNPWVSDDT